jgi:hypothetical protein
LNIQDVLRHEKGIKSIRSQDERNPNQKQRSQKSDYPILDTGVSSFSRTDTVRVGFEISFV